MHSGKNPNPHAKQTQGEVTRTLSFMYYSQLNSQRILSLLPKVQEEAKEWLSECEKQGVWVLVTDAYRNWAMQAWLYASGRIRPGKIVTYAKPGYSMHNFRVALDFVPADGNGKAHYEDITRYYQAINLAKHLGFMSGSDWASPKTDLPHLEFTQGHDIAYFRNGGILS